MLDACFRCGLMSAKWREINLSLIYWPYSANTAQVLLVIPAARTHFWHGIISGVPQNHQGLLRKSAPQVARPQPQSLPEVICLCLS